MRKLFISAVVLYGAFMGYVVVGGWLQKQNKENAISTRMTTPSSTVPTSGSQSATKTYTASEVAKHGSSSDCWLIINKNVYNVSRFLSDHPGGAGTILPYCGKEATRAFDTQDRGSRGSHSNQAAQMLQDYLVGTLQ